MQQEYLFKESTLGDDSVHLKWFFGKWCFAAHPTNPVEGCADANPKTMLPNDT